MGFFPTRPQAVLDFSSSPGGIINAGVLTSGRPKIKLGTSFYGFYDMAYGFDLDSSACVSLGGQAYTTPGCTVVGGPSDFQNVTSISGGADDPTNNSGGSGVGSPTSVTLDFSSKSTFNMGVFNGSSVNTTSGSADATIKVKDGATCNISIYANSVYYGGEASCNLSTLGTSLTAHTSLESGFGLGGYNAGFTIIGPNLTTLTSSFPDMTSGGNGLYTFSYQAPLNQASVDGAINALYVGQQLEFASSAQVFLAYAGASAPSAASATALAGLLAAGWTVNHN